MLEHVNAICTICRYVGSVLEFAFIPYPGPDDDPDEKLESTLRCPRCSGSATLQESPSWT